MALCFKFTSAVVKKSPESIAKSGAIFSKRENYCKNAVKATRSSFTVSVLADGLVPVIITQKPAETEGIVMAESRPDVFCPSREELLPAIPAFIVVFVIKLNSLDNRSELFAEDVL